MTEEKTTEEIIREIHESYELKGITADMLDHDSIIYIHGWLAKVTTKDGMIVEIDMRPKYLIGKDDGICVKYSGEGEHHDNEYMFRHMAAHAWFVSTMYLIDGCIYTASDGVKYAVRKMSLLNSDRKETLCFAAELNVEEMEADFDRCYAVSLVDKDGAYCGEFERDGETVTIHPMNKLENSL